MKKYPQTQSMITKREPARDPTSASDVTVPFLQAVIPAALATVIIGVIVAEIVDGVPPMQWLLVLFLAMTLVLYIGRSTFIQTTLMRIEQVTGLDVDGDGQVGKSRHPMVMGSGRGEADGRRQTADGRRRTADGPEQERLEQFLATCFRQPIKGKRPNSVVALRNAGFNDAEIEEYRDLLMRLGIAEWRNPHAHKFGWRLTAQHAAALSVVRSRVDWI